jgi:hypothetical protein
MKKLLLSFILLTFAMAGFSQNLSLSYDGNALPPNGNLMIICDPSEIVVTAYISCTNNSSVPMNVKTKKIIQEGDTLTGTSNYFCWGACFPDFVYVSPNYITIDPTVTNTDFYADYEPRTIPGVSRITYVFFDESNPNDSASVTVDWNASPAGLGEDILSQVSLSAAYPNPASTVARIDYELPAGLENSTLVVSNMLGATVKEMTLGNTYGRLEIPVANLPNGIYFYTLKGNNNLAVTKKFVVRH